MANRYNPPDPIPRFWAHVQKTETCWLWTAAQRGGKYGVFRGGKYGVFQIRGRLVGVHRFSYELHQGPIPPGLTIDHLCRNRLCVNPAHLEAVTMRVNVLRGNTITAAAARKTYCLRGHEFTPENTARYKSWRICRACQRQRMRLFRGRATTATEALAAVRTQLDEPRTL